MLAMAKDPIDRLSSPSQFVQLLELAGQGALGDKWRKRARALLQTSGGDAVDQSTLSVRLDDPIRARETLA
jgi:hypothetical protein